MQQQCYFEEREKNECVQYTSISKYMWNTQKDKIKQSWAAGEWKKKKQIETTEQWKQNAHRQKKKIIHTTVNTCSSLVRYLFHFILVFLFFFLHFFKWIWQYNSEKQFVAQDTKITENDK